MVPTCNSRLAMAALAWISLASIVLAGDIPMTYCASFNTASTNGNYSIYQTDGLCSEFCRGSYAFALVQNANCWCSNYEPDKASKVDVGKCNAQCPGFPADTCGADGLWGYMQLDKKSLGTKAADSFPSSTTAPPPSTNTGTFVSSTSVPSSSSSSSSASSTTSSSVSTSSATTMSPYVSVSVVTEGGTTRERTVTVTPTYVPASSSGTEITADHTGLTTGQAVGVAVGVLAFFVLLGAAGVFFWLRRKKETQAAEIPSHQNSLRGSSAGMMSTPRTEMASVWDGDSAGRRNSRLMPPDPRMDASGNIYSYGNKSHESVNTIQDHHDYSRRVLSVKNPDPTG